MRSETGSLPFFAFIISIVVLAMLTAMGSAKAEAPALTIELHQV